MKRILLTLIFATTCSHADSWGPDLIKFSLEGGPPLETMIWISGFSYSSTAFYQGCGALKKSEYIESKYLIEVLNALYAGETITSEQAAELLAKHLKSVYVCKTI